MKKIEFKVMAWLRALREKQAADLKGKSIEERVAYYRRKALNLQSKRKREKAVA